jgi:hypothetical protein
LTDFDSPVLPAFRLTERVTVWPTVGVVVDAVTVVVVGVELPPLVNALIQTFAEES